MPQKTNLSVAPYYDDFDTDKNFYKVLFRPGFAIQGRELTQLQSLLQNQIEQFGKYAFKQGEPVIPGEVGFNTKLPFVKLLLFPRFLLIRTDRLSIKSMISLNSMEDRLGV